MKLRIRSLVTKETIKLEAPDACTIDHLKTLIAARVSAPPGSLYLSLNRRDELGPHSPDDGGGSDSTLQSFGLTSGDLVYYTADPNAFARGGTLAPPTQAGGTEPGHSAQEMRGVEVAPSVGPVGAGRIDGADAKFESLAPDPQEAVAGAELPTTVDPIGAGVDANLHEERPDVNMVGESSSAGDDVEMEDECLPIESSSFSIPCFLRRVIEAEDGRAASNLGFLVIAIHAVFLESGFVVLGSSTGSRLPEGWASPAPSVLISYTIPDLAGPQGKGEGGGEPSTVAEPVKVKVSLLGKFANVYGSMSGSPDVYRVSLNASRFVPAVASSMVEISEKDETELFELWKMVKDGLALPLLIDICEKNGLASPPCFMCLPTDLKIKVLEFLPGVDLARIGCASSEFRYLSSNDDLWAKKFIEEFGLSEGKGLFGRRWKDKFIVCWEKRKKKKKQLESYHVYRMPPFWERHVSFPAPGFNIIGGDYDRFPAIGGLVPNRRGRNIPGPLARRNFSPNCNLGGFHI